MSFSANRSAAPSERRRLEKAQSVRKAAFGVLAIFAMGGLGIISPQLGRGGLTQAASLSVAIVLISAGVTLRVWSTMYVAGRKSAELVTGGPYAVVRNPLYVGTLACVAGAALAFGSLVAAAGITFASFLILDWIVKREEQRLSAEFGASFDAYALRVRRWLPSGRPRHAEWMSVRVANVARALGEALLFFGAIPLALLVAVAHERGWIEPLLTIP